MKTQTLRTFIDVHTWTGLIAGLALFMAFYAGAITVFTHELQAWENHPAWSAAADSSSDADNLVRTVIDRYPAARDDLYLQLPGEHGPHAVLYWSEQLPDGDLRSHEFRWIDGKVVDGAGASPLADFIYQLHYTAGLPSSWGIYVLGFVCILYGVALVSGVIIYTPAFLRDLFALRVGANLKRLWQDAHNVIGVLSLPFHAIFAWSGAVLCIGTLLLAPFQLVVFDGKLMNIIGPDLDLVAQAPATHVPQAMLSVPELVARARQALPDMQIELLQYSQAGDASAQVSVYGSTPARTVSKLAGVALDANSGVVLRKLEPGSYSAGTTFYRGLLSLHFADFGGMAVRWLYFILGLAGAFLFFSGNLLWIETRRNRRGPQQTRGGQLMARLTLGVALGCIAGVSAILVAGRLLPSQWESRAHDIQIVYYAVFLAALTWALLRQPARSAVELLLACAAFTLAIPVADACATRATPWRSAADGQWSTFAVHMLSLLFAAGFWLMARSTRRRSLHGDTNSVWAAPTRPAGRASD